MVRVLTSRTALLLSHPGLAPAMAEFITIKITLFKDIDDTIG